MEVLFNESVLSAANLVCHSTSGDSRFVCALRGCSVPPLRGLFGLSFVLTFAVVPGPQC